MRELCITVPESLAGLTVGKTLQRGLHLPSGYISRVKFRPDGIRLNGERVNTGRIVRAGDELMVQIGDIGARNEASPVKLPIRIVYEDEDIAVIYKSAGIVCHGVSDGEPTMANALAYEWGAEQAYHPVNRLDRGTTGLMAVAKSGFVHARLQKMLHTDRFVREYLAVTEGIPPEEEGTVELPLGYREGEARPVRDVDPEGQRTRTDYRVLETRGALSLVRLRLFTGRCHQIRIHMAALGCPLAGDTLYGAHPTDALDRPALHSCRLALNHPITGEALLWEEPLPEDMKMLFYAAE